MAAPTLDSDHPGLRVLAEVAGILAVGLASEDALAAAAGALRRGLGLRRARVWLRNPDGVAYHPIVAAGGEPPPRGLPSPPPAWLPRGPPPPPPPGRLLLPVPPLHPHQKPGLMGIVG